MRSRIPDNGKKTDIHILQRRITQAVLAGSGNIPVAHIGNINTSMEAINTVPPQIVKKAPRIFLAIIILLSTSQLVLVRAASDSDLP